MLHTLYHSTMYIHIYTGKANQSWKGGLGREAGSHLVSSDLTWTHLISLGLTWNPLISLGLAWTHLI